MRSSPSKAHTLLNADVIRLHAAAHAYAKAMVVYGEAWNAHQSNRILDEFDPRRTKTETTLFHADKDKEDARIGLCYSAMMFARRDGADLWVQFRKAKIKGARR